jgi:hypothetical protein
MSVRELLEAYVTADSELKKKIAVARLKETGCFLFL